MGLPSFLPVPSQTTSDEYTEEVRARRRGTSSFVSLLPSFLVSFVFIRPHPPPSSLPTRPSCSGSRRRRSRRSRPEDADQGGLVLSHSFLSSLLPFFLHTAFTWPFLNIQCFLLSHGFHVVLPSFTQSFLHAILPSSFPSFRPSFRPSFLPSFLPPPQVVFTPGVDPPPELLENIEKMAGVNPFRPSFLLPSFFFSLISLPSLASRW